MDIGLTYRKMPVLVNSLSRNSWSMLHNFLGNLGNYKGFGDSKFIPRCPPETIEAFASAVPKAKEVLLKYKLSVAAFYADY